MAPVEAALKTKTGLDDGSEGCWSAAWEFALQHRAVFACSFFDSFDWFAYAYMQPQIALAIFGGNNMHFAMRGTVPIPPNPFALC